MGCGSPASSAAVSVVEHLDVLGDGEPGACPGGERLPVVALVLQGGEERLGRGVVPTHPGPADTGLDVVGGAPASELGRSIHRRAVPEAWAAAGITQSMGRTGSALDNAVSEAFHSTLQFELLADQAPFATRAQARAALAGYLDEYNTQRRHSTCGMLSPRRLRTSPDGGMTRPRPVTLRPPHLRPGRYTSLRDRPSALP
jgi:hypothetical protein